MRGVRPKDLFVPALLPTFAAEICVRFRPLWFIAVAAKPRRVVDLRANKKKKKTKKKFSLPLSNSIAGPRGLGKPRGAFRTPRSEMGGVSRSLLNSFFAEGEMRRIAVHILRARSVFIRGCPPVNHRPAPYIRRPGCVPARVSSAPWFVGEPISLGFAPGSLSKPTPRRRDFFDLSNSDELSPLPPFGANFDAGTIAVCV